MTMTVRGRVRAGRLVVDEPVDLPDGTEVELTLADAGDELDDDDRAALHAAIVRGHAQIERGEYVSADAVLAELRAGDEE